MKPYELAEAYAQTVLGMDALVTLSEAVSNLMEIEGAVHERGEQTPWEGRMHMAYGEVMDSLEDLKRFFLEAGLPAVAVLEQEEEP